MPPDKTQFDPDAPSLQSVSRRCAVGTLLAAGTALIPARGSDAGEPKRRIVDASAYGVVADGITDDAPALLKAVAAMSNGSALDLPPGTIALGSTGWSGISIQHLANIRIQGNATILKWLARPSQATTGFGATGLRLLECQNAIITDIAVNGNGIGCVGIGLDTCSSCVVRGVEAFGHGVGQPNSGSGQFASAKGNHNTWQRCVARDSTPGSQFRGYYLGNSNSDCGESDLRIDGCVARRNTARGFAISAVRMICVNCVSENNGGAGFTSSTANGSPSVDHVFQGNVAQMNAFHGWQTDVYGPNAERVVLTGNIFSGNKYCGVYCHKGTNISVVGNIINGNGAETATAAVSLSMSNSITVSNNIIEGDATHGKCIVFNFAANKVSDVIIADNLCRGSASKTVHIEASDTMTALQRVVASGNIINGGSHGLYVGTSAPGAVLDTVTLVNNIVGNATTASYFISDHTLGQSTNVRLVGNTGAALAVNPNVRLADERDNSWNSFRGDGTASPTQGAWLQGAIIFNAVPSPGSPIGWVCTVSGNPGTWNEFGVIGA